MRLIVYGPDQQGLVAEVTSVIADNGANILSLHQHTDESEESTFFQRMVLASPNLAADLPRIEKDLARVLTPRNVEWTLTRASQRKRMVVLASKSGYCLLDLLWRQQQGLLPVEIPMVISNHRDLEESVRSFGVPFHHVPSAGADKTDAERRILSLIGGQADFLVLARYMQILSGDFLRAAEVPIINIHHSFLPAFIGADPYRQALQRGVKLIGATAHYVTEDLDEGPIIEQETARVSHATDLSGLRARGAIVERTVLSRAVRWHAEDRVIRHRNHTIIFE